MPIRDTLKKFSSRLPARGTTVRIIAISAIVMSVLVVALGGYVYYQAVKTFEVRRVALPTRIYTDMFPLTGERTIAADVFREKLSRLGYRETETVREAGDFSEAKSGYDIYLRPFNHPAGNHKSQRVRLGVDEGAIATVVAHEDGGAVTNAALEPELLTSILGDQLENRRPVTIDQIPKQLVDAVVATEDVRFFQHPGVDPIGIFRALFKNIRAKGVAEGGSTLTQQLVKNYYLTNERTMRRKVVEAFMSLILDAKYSKKEILEAYLNDIYLGRNRSISILGVGEASRFFFGKPVNEISIAEAALLAGIIRSPNNYSPFTHPEKALARRNTVLGLMLRQKKITQAEHDQAMAEKLPKKPYREKSGLTSIPFYVDRVLQEMRMDYGIDDVKGRGLAIYTAIDLDWQDTATQTMQRSLASLEKASKRLRRSDNPLQGVMIAVDVPTGEIRALVGGRNYETSQFNRALYSKRQVGSLFKPFVFLAAFEPSLSSQNITPATLVNDSRFVYKEKFAKDWSPRNYEEKYYGVVTVRRALEQSMNSAAVRIGLSTGLDSIIKTAHVLGVDEELQSVPSLILGSVGIPPIEMAEAYTTIGRVGSRIPLHAIRFVTNEGGGVVDNGDEIKPTQVFPARDVYLAVRVMQGVVQRGTAAGVRSYGFTKNAAGKTGTTNEKRDAWFIGFTPKTLGLTWIGFDDNEPVGVSGSDGAVPIWARFMREATKYQADGDFAVPPGIVFASVDATSGGLATSFCPANTIVNEAFKEGTQPSGSCALHRPAVAPMVVPEPYPGMEQPMPADPGGGTVLAPGATATLSPTENSSPLPRLGGGNFPETNPAPPPPPPPPPPPETPPPTDTTGTQ